MRAEFPKISPLPEAAAGAGRPVRRIFANLGLLLTGRAIAGILSVIYMVVAARALGPRDYGVLVLVHAYVVAVGGVIGFPTWHAIIRYGAKPLAEGDGRRLGELLRFFAALESAAGVLAVALAALLVPWVGPKLGWSAEAQSFGVPYSLAILAAVRTTPAGFLQLVGRLDLVAAHAAVAPSVRLAGALAASAAGGELEYFLVAWLAAAIAEWASMWLIGLWIASRHVPARQLLSRFRRPARPEPGLWRFMLIANADVTLADFAGRTAPLAVGWILGPAAAGLFAVAQRATVILAQPAQILGQAAYSELAKLVATGAPGELLRRALLGCIAASLAIAGPIILLLAFFSADIVLLLGGPAFAGAAPVLIWLAAARTFGLIGPPCSAALIAMGRPGFALLANAGLAVLLLPLLPLLSVWLGLIGTGAHALIQAALTASLLSALVWAVSGRATKRSSDEALEEIEVLRIEAAEPRDLS